MKLKEETKGTFSLPKETVTVKFIPRKKGIASDVPDNHIVSGGMLDKAVMKYSAPLQKNGAIANVLTKEEKDYIEGMTGLNLSVYGDFWETFFVHLRKEDANNIFDLSDPLDFISVRILEHNADEIAPNWKSRNDKTTYSFAITRDGEIFDEAKVKLDVKKEAFKAYGKIEDDKERLLDVLKLLSNKPISADSKMRWIQGQVERYVDNDPKAFLSVAQDPLFDVKALLNKAIEKKVVIKTDNKYQTADGLILAENGQAPSYDNAVKYLHQDKNYDVRALIEAKINEA